jgi:hypothetical protein
MRVLTILIFSLTLACDDAKTAGEGESETAVAPKATTQSTTQTSATTPGQSKAKLTAEDCIDPDLAKVLSTTSLMLCDGTIVAGSLVMSDDGELSIAACELDGATGCLANSDFPAADATAALAGNIKEGVTIAGTEGALTTDGSAPADCDTDGQTGCLTNANYKAAKMSGFAATDVLTGRTVAGISGSATAKPSDCASDGELGCVTVSAFKAAKMANFTASVVESGTTIAGVGGSATLTPGDCNGDGQVGCVTISAYKSADMTIAIAGNIKNTIEIAGITGTFTGAANCTADAEVGCVTTSTYKAADTAAFAATDIRFEVTVAGVAGNRMVYETSSSFDGTVNQSIDGTIESADLTQTVVDNLYATYGMNEATSTLYYSTDSGDVCSSSGIGTGWTASPSDWNAAMSSSKSMWSPNADGIGANGDYYICIKITDGLGKVFYLGSGAEKVTVTGY